MRVRMNNSMVNKYNPFFDEKEVESKPKMKNNKR